MLTSGIGKEDYVKCIIFLYTVEPVHQEFFEFYVPCCVFPALSVAGEKIVKVDHLMRKKMLG
jgi:hypothetical protein